MALDVAAIRSHLARLAELVPDDPRWWRGGPIWSEAKLRRFEATHFTLPADYRTWLAVVGDGGLLLMDTEYESWKRYGAMLPLAGRKRAELARAARPFRLVGECIPRSPISGVLHLATFGGANDRYLVVVGKRVGEVWERSVYTDYCYPIGTFAGMVDDWIAQSTKAAETWAAPRGPATLAAFVPAAQFWQLTGSNLIPWLRDGAEIFVDTFRQLPREDHDRAYFAFESALDTYVEQLIATPRLAGVAAIALLGVLDERYRPRSELEHALVAIFNAEQPDLSPANVARLIAAVAEGSDHSTANWPARWLQMALVTAGRLDEALALFRVQPYLLAGDWVRLARACVARGRGVEAFAALQCLITNPDRPRGERPATYELAGAWLRLEAGDRPSAIAALERIDDVDFRDVGSLVTAMRTGREGSPPEFHPSYPVGAVASEFGRTCDYGLVSLLYGVAGDGAHMVDTAIRALSVDAVRRDKQQHSNHLAHLRIGQALLGTIERAPRLTVDYGAGSRARLAEAVLARVGKLGIVLSERASELIEDDPVTDLKTLVDDIISLGNELRELEEFELAVPNGPADPEKLKAFAQAFQGRVPPSFVELLSIYDGIERFDWVDLTIHGVDYLTEHPDLDDSWIEAEHFEPDEVFVFAWAETDSSCLAFRRTKVDADGEMAVVSFDAKGPIWNAKNLRAFLEMRKPWFQKGIDDTRKERGLPPKYKATTKKPTAKKPAAKKPAAKKPAAKKKTRQ